MKQPDFRVVFGPFGVIFHQYFQNSHSATYIHRCTEPAIDTYYNELQGNRVILSFVKIIPPSQCEWWMTKVWWFLFPHPHYSLAVSTIFGWLCDSSLTTAHIFAGPRPLQIDISRGHFSANRMKLPVSIIRLKKEKIASCRNEHLVSQSQLNSC